jgi:molybdopterin-guanine dinucleotide biosynthesis protein A
VKINEDIYGLILTGGQSRRMGMDKASLEHEGVSQLSETYKLLNKHLSKVCISVRKDQIKDATRSNYQQIIDIYDNLGPLAGILSAMKRFPTIQWLIVACDLVNLDSRTLSYLIENFSTEHCFIAYKSEHDGLPEPLCAIYSSKSIKIIENNISKNIRCPRKILLNSDTLLLSQPNPRALDNFNSPNDLINSKYKVKA